MFEKVEFFLFSIKIADSKYSIQKILIVKKKLKEIFEIIYTQHYIFLFNNLRKLLDAEGNP